MRYVDENRSVVQDSDDLSNINVRNNTLDPNLILFLAKRTHILLLVIPDTLFAIGLVANLLLIYYIFHHKKHKSSIFALILCLAICDLSTCSATIFLDNVMRSMFKPGYLCPIAIFLVYTSFMTTGYHLVAVAVIRFYQLVYPLSARSKVTPSRCFRMSVIIWTLSLPFSIPLARYYLWIDVTYNDADANMCVSTEDSNFRNLLITIGLGIIPTFLTSVFHVAKHCIVTQQHVPQLASSASGQENKRQRTDIRAVMTVITIFIVSSLPTIIHRGIHGILQVPNSQNHLFITRICDKILFSNSIINPFIYAFASSSVRTDLKAMFVKVTVVSR